MIRYICDMDGCDSSIDVRQAKLPPGWSCDPILDSKGVYTREMAYVCPECMETRRGRFAQERAERLASAKKQQAAPKPRKKRSKPKKEEPKGQEALF